MNCCQENFPKGIKKKSRQYCWTAADRFWECSKIFSRQNYWLASMTSFGNFFEKIRGKNVEMRISIFENVPEEFPRENVQVERKEKFERSDKKIRAKMLNCSRDKCWSAAEKFRECMRLNLKLKCQIGAKTNFGSPKLFSRHIC